MNCSMPDFPVHRHLPEFALTRVHWVGDAIQPSYPLSPHSLPSFSLSQHQVFSSGSALLIRWPKYWSFRFSISPSSEYSGLTSLRIDWFDFLAIQQTLQTHLQHHNLEASIFSSQLSLLSNFHNCT